MQQLTHPKGFTLFELLATLVLITGLLILITQAVIKSSQHWVKASQTWNSEEQIYNVLEHIALDIESIDPENEWVETEMNTILIKSKHSHSQSYSIIHHPSFPYQLVYIQSGETMVLLDYCKKISFNNQHLSIEMDTGITYTKAISN